MKDHAQFLLHPETHQVLSCDDAQDVVLGVDHGEMPETEGAEDDVGPVEGEVVRDAGGRLVHIRHLMSS